MPRPTVEQFGEYGDISTQLADVLEGISAEQLHYKPEPGAWSVNEVVTHLADTEVTVYTRSRKIIAEDHPTLQVFHEELWANGLHYQEQDAQLLLTLFTMLRRANVNLWTLLPAEAWERLADHPEQGTISLYDLFTTYLQHSKVHLNQIKENLQKQGSQVR